MVSKRNNIADEGMIEESSSLPEGLKCFRGTLLFEYRQMINYALPRLCASPYSDRFALTALVMVKQRVSGA